MPAHGRAGGFLLGLICGAVLALGLALADAEIFRISPMEGAYAMAVLSIYMPAGGLVGGIGAVWIAQRTRPNVRPAAR